MKSKKAGPDSPETGEGGCGIILSLEGFALNAYIRDTTILAQGPSMDRLRADFAIHSNYSAVQNVLTTNGYPVGVSIHFEVESRW